MDLYAYCQIGKYEKILKDNNIIIERLRGIRMMAEEEGLTEEEINETIETQKKEYLINWLQQHSDDWWSSDKADKRHKAFIYGKNKDGKKEIVGYDFSKVHGKDRKHIKHHWKMIRKAFSAQYEMWNKYVGKNVLYVHARLGSTNWSDYKIDEKHPMFLEHIDDAWDTSYCDIYYDLDKGIVALCEDTPEHD